MSNNNIGLLGRYNKSKYRIRLDRRSLNRLPENIGNLSNLRELSAEDNNLVELPESIGKLINLEIIDLENNKLTSLPQSIGNLAFLKKLNVDKNYLSSLPSSIGNLKNLETLFLGYNKLSSLPSSIGNLTNVKELDLQYNDLTSLPASIGNLKNLEMLNLSENELTSLPESIGNLKNLASLFLFGTKLTSLPESVGSLTKLQSLDLMGNRLSSLPESIGKLTNLDTLYLSKGTFTSLPETFKNLRSTIIILYDGHHYRRNEFIKLFKPHKPKRVSKNTELFNSEFSETTKISKIPTNKRVYIYKNSNVKNTGELRRLYNKNAMTAYMANRNEGRLHGNTFTKNNIEKLTNKNTVNKNVYLRNFKNRLINSPLNNWNDTVKKIKKNLPSNISHTEVNTIVRSMKPQVLQKIFNKLKNSPSNTRLRLMNNFKSKGLMNNTDIVALKKKLLGSNFVRNSQKSPPITTIKRKRMNSNNAVKSPYI